MFCYAKIMHVAFAGFPAGWAFPAKTISGIMYFNGCVLYLKPNNKTLWSELNFMH
jgi:hypothetical protein